MKGNPDRPVKASIGKSMQGGCHKSVHHTFSNIQKSYNKQKQLQLTAFYPEVLRAKLGLCLGRNRAKHMCQQTCSMLSACAHCQSPSSCMLLTFMFGSRNCRNTMMIKLMPSRSCNAHAHELDLYTNQTATVAIDRPKLKMACTKTSPNGGWMVWCGSSHAQRGVRAAVSA